MKSKSIVLVGGGGHALVVREAAELGSQVVVGFYDDNRRADLTIAGSPWLGSFEKFRLYGTEIPAIFALGDLRLREELQRSYRGPLAKVVHPHAIVSRAAMIGPGAVVAAGAVVAFNASIGWNGIVNTRAVVEHDCDVADNVHIAPGAVLGGGVRVGRNTLLGLNSSVNPNLVIGENCVVGAGAVVVRDVPDFEVVVGNPARPIPASVYPYRRSA